MPEKRLSRMAEPDLKQLRALRSRAAVLNQNVALDYRAFYDSTHKVFFRLPSSPPDASTPVSVTTNATALMALSMNRVVDKFFVDESNKDDDFDAKSRLTKLLRSAWASANLPPNNAFTTALVVRAAGRLVQDNVLDLDDVTVLKREFKDDQKSKKWQRFHGKSMNDLVATVLSNAPESLQFIEYSTAPPIAYWFMDGAINLGVDSVKLESLARWFSENFIRQISLIGANHPALTDPIAMAMAAAGCKRIASWAPELRAQVEIFPSEEELQYGVELFFQKQNSVGTWEKYFPMFHYPTAGSNHCWHIEALESLLKEFPDLVENQKLLCRLEASVNRLETSRLKWKKGGEKPFYGWNSGGQLSTLSRGEPESWATGVVHMFLHTLVSSLSAAIRSRILRGRRVTTIPTRDNGPWEKILDSRAPIKGFKESGDQSLKNVVNELTIQPILTAEDKNGPIRLIPEGDLKRSALIFGPPGTGKTRFVRAVADKVGWDFLQITPSVFVGDGLDHVYSSADRLFRDLDDVERAVVFFDEMDAMLQRRVDDEGKQQLSLKQQFMTTCMLPHLAELYDSRKVLFFFATNHRESFDAAITRAGRFDMMLFMGPPTWKEKAQNINLFSSLADKKRTPELTAKMLEWVPESDDKRNDILTRATFAETCAFFRDVCSGKPLDVAILDDTTLKKPGFLGKIDEWGENEFTLCKDGSLKEQYEEERVLSEVRW